MKLNINDLLRRLPIIMLEDTYLHSSITTIIWLMIALGTQKFLMKKYIYEWILGFSYICCITKKTDFITFSNGVLFKSTKFMLQHKLFIVSVL